MPGKIAAFRELPGTIEKTTIIAGLALVVSVVALLIALGARHAS
jgi:hypothetical protein